MKQSRKTRRQLIEELEAIKTNMGLPADKEPGKDYGNGDLSGYMGLFRAITESMLDAMVIIDWQGDIRYANRAAFNLVGIPEDTPLDSLNIFQFVHPNSAQEAESDLSLVSRGTDSFVAVYKLITGDGSQRWVETLGRKILFEGSQADLVNIRDVTRRRLAEEELRTRQARLDSIFRAVPTGIGVVADRVFLEVNDRICQMTGYSREELIGKSARMLYPTLEDYDYVGREKYDQIRETGTGSVETRWRRKDGSIIDIILSSTPIDPTDLSSGVTFSALDITERKQTENALIESEERYRRITSSISDYIYTVFVENGCTVRTVHSPACEAVTGYTVEEFAADPYLWITMVHEQDRELVSNRASQVLSGIDTGTIEHRIRHRDGSILWISNTPVLHRNPHGELTSYDGVVKDITQRKRSEEALLESEKKYHSLFLNNHAVMLLIDPSSGRIMDANPAACTYYGYTRQELTSKLMSDINTLSPNQVFKKMEMAQTGKTRRFEFHHRLADGDIRDVEVYSGPITIGGEELLYSIIHDITDRKRAQEALKESEDRFRSLIQNSYDIIVILDKTGSFVYETPSVQRVLGYESGYLIGRTPQDLVHPDDLEAIAGALDEVYSDINPGTPTQFRFLRADGSWIYLEAVGKNLLDYPGINGVVITARDITERKKSETNRIDMEKRLLHAQKLESLGVMAGGIAHDFNNLLMAILGNLDLALTDLSPVSRSRRFIDQALLAGRRAADLTNQMLAYSGRGRFDLKSFDISELVEEMARLLKASISKTVTLNLQLKDSLPPIVADPSQIQQIVMNLIVNASEAVGDTAGTVTVSTGVRQCNDEYLLQSRLRQKPEAGKYVFLKVSDTGCGMDQETQERLFDPFFTTKFTGRGLGMAAVLGIVRGHKGAIMVESEPARGTSISILLPAGSGRRQPLGKKPKGRIHTTAEPEQSHRQTRTILIVDDEQMVLDLCSSMVNHFGYTVLKATDGNEAVKIFRRHKKEIDCVILDLTMPKKDGIVAFEELRKIRNDIPVIISSGYDEQEIGRRFQGKGLSGIIKKPYNIEELRKELKRVLRG